MGAPVLRAAIERADELHAALVERNQALEEAGYHAQVAVAPQSSLLFLIDEKNGARMALEARCPQCAAEPKGLWQAGRETLLNGRPAWHSRRRAGAHFAGCAAAARFSGSVCWAHRSPSAGRRRSPTLRSRRCCTSGFLAGSTPAEPRFSATLIEPAIGELLRKHELSLDRVFAETADSLAHRLAARAMPIEGKRKLCCGGNALDAELEPLLDWMRSLDAGLGRSAETAASKMRYQMNRLRRLAANFEMQREGRCERHAEAIERALYPGGVLQERVHGAAYYFARYGFELAETLTGLAGDPCPGHKAVWL